jgi:hypothetical protein
LNFDDARAGCSIAASDVQHMTISFAVVAQKTFLKIDHPVVKSTLWRLPEHVIPVTISY